MSELDTHVRMYALLHTLGIVSTGVLDDVTEYAKHDVILSKTSSWDASALQKVRVLTLHVASGFHDQWQDGGWTWHVLKLESEDKKAEAKYALVGGFHPILPLALKPFTQEFRQHLTEGIQKAFYKITIHIDRDGQDVQEMISEWQKLAESVKQKTTTARSHAADGAFPVLQIHVEAAAG